MSWLDEDDLDQDLDRDLDPEDPADDDCLQSGCLFPGECCMPGEHLTMECHTAEMLEGDADGAPAARVLVQSWAVRHKISASPAALADLVALIAAAIEGRRSA